MFGRNHVATLAQRTVWFPAALSPKFSIDCTVDLNVGFAGVPHAASPNYIQIGSVAMGSSQNFVTFFSHAESWISNEQEVVPPAFVAVHVYKYLFLSLRFDTEIEFPGLSALPNLVLVE